MAVSRLSQQSLQQAFPKGNTVWDGTTSTSAFDCISAVTLTASQTAIEFNNIPQTYTHLQVRYMASSNSNGQTRFTFNNDAGSNYVFHSTVGDGTSATSNNGANNAFIMAGRNANLGYTTTSVFQVGVIDFLDYANTNKMKTTRSLVSVDNNSSGGIDFESGAWFKAGSGVTSDAITSITFFNSSTSGNFIANSAFALYGVK
jgi:hypothetical protein